MLNALRIAKMAVGTTGAVLTLVKSVIDIRQRIREHRDTMERIHISREATAAASATISERINLGYYDNFPFDLPRLMNDFEFERIVYERPN